MNIKDGDPFDAFPMFLYLQFDSINLINTKMIQNQENFTSEILGEMAYE